MEYLSDIEKDKIITFNQDEVLVEAVRKVLLASIYNNGTLRKDLKADPAKNAALGLAFLAIGGSGVVTNADLGEDLRGLAQGVSLLEKGLAQLAKIKSKTDTGAPEGDNPGI